MPSERLVRVEGRDVKDLPGLHKRLEEQGFTVISCDQSENSNGTGPSVIVQLDPTETRDPTPVVESFQDTVPGPETWVTLVSSNGSRWQVTVRDDGTLAVRPEG